MALYTCSDTGYDWKEREAWGNAPLTRAPPSLVGMQEPAATVETAMLDKRLPHHLVMEHIKKQTCKNLAKRDFCKTREIGNYREMM